VESVCKPADLKNAKIATQKRENDREHQHNIDSIVARRVVNRKPISSAKKNSMGSEGC